MTESSATHAAPGPQHGSALEVLRVFFVLGLTSFGGPVAHLGYFREAFVVRRGWLGEAAYADLIALCQLLPGPASSQAGMGIGLMRAGWAGMAAAFIGFTLPSAILMIGFAYGMAALGDAAGTGWIAGLKAAAVAVVANAVLGMARTLAPDRERALIAALGMAGALLIPFAIGQVAVIGAGALIGLLWLRAEPGAGADGGLAVPVGRRTGAALLAVFFALLIVLPVWAASGNGAAVMADGFYRAGALVFGGGHVVLPLLDAETVETGRVSREGFLAGYGAAQALPGPLFAFAAYLGAVHETSPNGLAGAGLALGAIFLPAGLLIAGALPFWERLRASMTARRALMGVNAAVVGLLAAALYDPVFTEGIPSAPAMAVAALSFVALAAWKVPAWAVVIGAGLVGFAAL